MPGKNKPKRFDRNRAWRVARRKKKQNKLASGGSRNRKPRPKNKGKIVEAVKSVVKKMTKKIVKKVAKKKE
jgi:hypothetical protein